MSRRRFYDRAYVLLMALSLLLLLAGLAFELWRRADRGRPDHRPASTSRATGKGRPAGVDSGPMADVASAFVASLPMESAESRPAPYRTGRPIGVRLPRIETPALPCVRLEWRWPYVLWAWDHRDDVPYPVTLTLFDGRSPVRQETREHTGPLSELRWSLVMPRGEFFGRDWRAEMAGNGWTRSDSLPGFVNEVDCEEGL